jgi:hypothetical protein
MCLRTDGGAPKTWSRKMGTKKKAAAAEVIAPQEPARTLGDLAQTYLAALEEDGKSYGTVASYSMELRAAQEELGAKTELLELTPERIGAFFVCNRVMRLKNGTPKSVLSMAKTRRVLRQALLHAQTLGWIKDAPLSQINDATSAVGA